MKMTMRLTSFSPGGYRLLAATLFSLNLLAPLALAADLTRERLSFDSDWRFVKGDPPGTGDELSYTNIKPWVVATGNEFLFDSKPAARPPGNPGADVAYTQSRYDDGAWQQLNLPHDWGMDGPFKPEAPGSTGKLPWEGVGWYRKHFTVPASDVNRRLCLEVDGAMSYANVWLNGQYLGGWPYGYSSWELDLTPWLKTGAENVLAIRLDNPPASSRWYPGGGIYRNVWLVKTGPVHVAHWGTYVTTPEVSASAAKVKIQVTVDNETDAATSISVKNEIYELGTDNAKGEAVASTTTDGVQIAPHSSQTVQEQALVKNPLLWSLKKPQRYVVATTVEQNGILLDEYETPFGVRTVKFDPDRGFFLNGEHVRLNGVCDHADLGALGTAINVRALQRQIEILQEMGCNAIRTSHNPPAPELLDLCDRMGMLVMDESFDCWQKGKRPNDYHRLFNDWHEKDWRAELRRDRNHPSIVLWSIGNEVPDQGTPGGPAIAAELTRIAHEEDPTRPTTAACDHPASGFNGFQTNLDVFGYNYKPFLYAKVHQANPNLPIFGSETASCISSRGEYFYPVSTNKNDGKSNFQMSSYDLSAPPWATIPDTEFRGQDENPFVAGEFVWTGFDYLGEPTPYDAPGDPSRSSYFGIVDLAGFKKDRFYLYQARWRPELPMAHIVPQCWTWPDRVGQTTPVFVYTSGDSAELFLNGKSLGLMKKDPYQYRLCWNDVKYEPGKLKVVAYKNGKPWATDEVKTSGPAAKLALQPDRTRIRADGRDLSFITLTVEDKHGLVVPRADDAIHFDISGPGEIVATDNGDATDLVSFPSPDRKAFNGLCLAIIRAKAGQTGTIKLTASAGHLKTARVSIKAE
ncbi:MAG TPA: beta-galactosidase GalB [Candidatus Acidoferrales bacterium]|nr:beta-galactosidase GalB [Candidatus Acidoferrales bacterium]